ncbi:Spc98 family-domain-containing protein [Phascolomyces articulosus]|uniref:Spindle pole body component n=1 Tax=Phascolomyces articulosus TaxID=60185 RepID=A0AAD5JN31_9FUNG|nr:Spc98 family-domain-containing protein [Phascolomyces articulosus]
MAPYDKLLRDLTEHWLCTKADDQLIQSLHNTLTRFRATSTDEFSIDRRWESLCEKISIKGQGDLAQNLRVLKTELFDPNNDTSASSSMHNTTTPAQERIVKYDTLSLILALSQGTQPDYLPRTRNTSSGILNEKELWNQIMEEEPLGGDHWKQWSEDEDEDLDDMTSTDSDQLVWDHERYAQFQRDRRLEEEQSSHIATTRAAARDAMLEQRMDEIKENINLNDDNDLRLLKERQYWREINEENDQHISEADSIREVLFLLRGYTSILFQKTRFPSNAVGTQHFEINPRSLTLKHLSQNALIGILDEFCHYGNMIYNLREWSNNKSIHDDTLGQTCTAFAICVAKLLQDFEMLLSDLEVHYCKLDEQSVISLLQLKESLNDPIQAFKTIYDIIIESPVRDLNNIATTPRVITARILNGLYNGILHAQLIGQEDTYGTLIHVFCKTIKPYGYLLNDWITRASLQGDRCQEFFIRKCNNQRESDNQSSDFWSNGYQICHQQEDEENYNIISPCPLFDPSFVKRAMFVGKAVLIISKFGMKIGDEYRSFDECLQSVVAQPKPVIKTTSMTTFPVSSTTKCNTKNSYPGTTARNIFLQAAFPLQIATTDSQLDDIHSHQNDGVDEVPFLFDQSLVRCLDKYITQPYKQTTHHLNRALRNNGLLENCLLSIASIYMMLDTNLMHVFCESLFIEMDINHGAVTEDAVQKLFMDAKLTIEWSLPGTSRCYLEGFEQSDFLSQIRFAYHIPWPINNFIKESTLKQYGTITTFLLQLKRAKYLLDRKMLFQQSQCNMRLYPMRMKLIWFINAFWGYVMTTILHIETVQFRKSIEKAMDADEIVQLHNDYVSRIVDRCLLGDKTQSIHKAVLKILSMVSELTILFASANEDETQYNIDIDSSMDDMEKDFNRSNDFIATTLKIVGRKGGFPWCKLILDTINSFMIYI